eukprot:155947_1
MPSSKHSRKSRKTKSFQYGHKYRSLEICEGDTSTAAGLKACIRRLKWMNDDFLYRVDKEGKRGKMKNKKALNLCLETQCDDRIKELAKLHQSMISQGALIQNVFRNRIIGDKKLSVSPVVQYLIFTTFAEHAKIIYRFKTEGGAWEKNKQLMTEALEANGDDCEYKIGLWDVHYEGKTRIPRAPQQMNEKKRGNACTEYYVRLNPVRIAAHYQGNDLAEWQKIEGIWKKFGVDRILHEYLTRFFPGNEEKAMDLGILKVDNMQGKDAFRKQKKKENDEMLSFI